MTPRPTRGPEDWPVILQLIQSAFAFMDGRIDPPSSMHRLTVAAIAEQAQSGEIWVTGTPVAACVFLTPKPQALYIGKLAVAADRRGCGLARGLIDVAEARAKALSLPVLELQTRIELVENQQAFRAMGFHEAGRSSHPGFDRPTTITFHRKV